MSEEQVFAAAIAIQSPVERARFVCDACGGDEQLKADVLRLLAAHDQADSLLDRPADVDVTVDVSYREPFGAGNSRRVGPYKLLQQIGEGGFGIVYMAEQDEPVRRRVAVKIIRPGMDSKDILARFEAERQALAMMDHPNIAKVYGGGTTANGHPYVAMELVKGVPITNYCDENCIDINARLRLFVSVCHAVQHAHQKGVIHRDLKPSNVLVSEYDDEAVPKIIDFGVAKAINQRLTERTMFTQFGQVIGTVQYLSPEQSKFNQLDIDTRSDVYSLGVILYELLTGSTPIDAARLRSAAFDEIMRVIREEEPPKPSTRIGTSAELPTVAKRRQAEPRRLPALVRGDLDWITMKALEKDRGRRYATANDLAADCQRFLEHDPVSACPPSLLYRARKFVHRNRGGVVIATLAATLLLVLLGTGIGMVVVGAQNETVRLKAVLDEQRARDAEKKQRDTEAALTKEQDRRQRQDKLHAVDLPELERLLGIGEYRTAFERATKFRQEFPDDTRLSVLWPQVARQWVVETEPAGARVSLRLYGSKSDQWGPPVGTTPLAIAVAKGFYQWRIELDQFVTIEGCAGPDSVTISRKLESVEGAPVDMVLVLGSEMPSLGRDFYIDRTEVTNRAFKDFVDAGGYGIRDYWKHPFFDAGRVVGWEEATRTFLDRTQRPGPANWNNGTFPEGQGDVPVTGISWYEAAAYAAFKQKELPTIHHWKAASGNSIMSYILPASNFAGGAPARVGSYPGVGPFGTVDTAGNVREWCWNGSGGQSHRYVLGGASSDPDYMFNINNSAPAMRRDPLTGFRCARYIDPPSSDLFADTTIPVFYHVSAKPVNDEQYELLRRRFDYQKGELNPVVRKGESGHLWEEKIVTVDAAYEGRLDIHIYEPKAGPHNRQVLVVYPGVGAFKQDTFYPEPYCFLSLESLIELGRTVVWPAYAGMYHRNTERFSSNAEAEIRRSQDLSRSLDYLEATAEYANAEFAYIGYSQGGLRGPMNMAVEKRLALGIFVNGGFPNSQNVPPPETDPVNFAPRVQVPILMINGQDDAVFPIETCQIPLFQALGVPAEHKRHVTIPGAAHGVDREVVEREVVAWLDKYFQPVTVEGIENIDIVVSRLTRVGQQSQLVSRYEVAQRAWHDLMQALKDAGRENTPEYWRASCDLAIAVTSQAGKQDEAERLFRSTYDAQLGLLGQDHPDTRKTHFWLVNVTARKAWFVVLQGGSDEALQTALRQSNALRAMQPNLAFCVIPSAWAYYALNDDVSAWNTLEEAAPLTLGWTGVRSASWWLRAIVRFKQGDIEEAVDWYRLASLWHSPGEDPAKKEAIRVLGEAIPVLTRDEELLAAFGRVIPRYPEEYCLPFRRGLWFLALEDIEAAHADFAVAFEMNRRQPCVDWLLADYFGLTCQLMRDENGLRQTQAAMHEMMDEFRNVGMWDCRNYVLSYCRSSCGVDYSTIAAFAREMLIDDSESLTAARNIADFRKGETVEVRRVYSEDDVERTVYSLFFRVLSEARKGNRQVALERLEEALEFTTRVVPTAAGPDFKWSNRARTWAVSQVLLAEVQQAIELKGSECDEQAERAVAELRKTYEKRFGEASAARVLARIGYALVDMFGQQDD